MTGDQPQPRRGVKPYVKKWGRTPKLTEEMVREIKERLRAGERIADIAVRYSVSTTTIGQIRAGEVWGWVD